ncbi:MAG: 23S rRNA (uracil(1939)-C(5))-methyltransferase RlmD [Terriglobia bacterium]
MESPVTVRIEKMIPGGKGLAFHQGKAVFVPQSAPGDLIRIQSLRDRGNYFQALAFEILEPGVDRVTPPCPFFGACGGCDFQQMNYSQQLSSKRDLLLDSLRRIGKLGIPPEIMNVFPSPPQHYRNRIQLKLTPGQLPPHWGFYAGGSHQVCEVDDCLIVTKTLWEAAQCFGGLLNRLEDLQGELDEVEILEGDDRSYLVNLVLSKREKVSPSLLRLLKQRLEESNAGLEWTVTLKNSLGREERVWGNGYVWKSVGEFRYRVSHGAFFQINEMMLSTLQTQAMADYSGKLALDLFSGVGFFTLPLTRRFESLVAVEVNPDAALDLRANLEINRAVNCRTVALDVQEYLRQESSRVGSEPDLLLMDPPRAGLPPETVKRIAGLRAQKLIYVSCDPATLARDLSLLVKEDYEIVSVDLLDLFPQTHHLEGVARLQRTSKKR